MSANYVHASGGTYCWRWWLTWNGDATETFFEYAPDTLVADGW